MKKFVTAVLILFVCSSVLFSADLKTYQSSYDKQMSDILLEHGATISKLNASYSKSLNNISERAIGAGDLDMMQAVMAEIKRFEAEKTVHEEASQVNAEIKKIQQAYIRNFKSMELAKAKKVLSLSSKYDSALVKLQISLAKQKKIDEAVAVKNERESVAKSKDVASAKMMISAAAEKSSKSTSPVAIKTPMSKAKKVTLSSLSKDLMLHYTFDSDRGSKVEDSSGKRNHGDTAGAPSKVKGVKGSALLFDGVKDFVVVRSKKSPGVDGVHESDYSLSLWFKPSSRPKVGEGIGIGGILMKAGYHLGLVYSESGEYGIDTWMKLKASRSQGNPDGVTGFMVRSSQSYDLDRWVHLVATVDENTKSIRLYIDGILEAEKKWQYEWDVFENREPWRIGMGRPGDGKFTAPANGCVDEVRIYSRALPADEIQKLYESAAPKQ